MTAEAPEALQAAVEPRERASDTAIRSRARSAIPTLLARWAPWCLLAVLIALCAVHGARMTAGLVLSPDVDSYRDIGYAQAFLDGNPLGDPTHIGEWRFYPPLLVWLRALLFRISGATDLPAFWVQTGPWLNLLVPLVFFGMARQLASGSAAAAALATAVLVLWNAAWGKPHTSGGYTPWPSGPVLATVIFFGTVWLIRARVEAAHWRDAVLTGACVGLAFLAHVVPAVVLTAIVTVAAFVAQGLRARTLLWLAVVAVVQMAVMSPYLLPVLFAYPGGTIHSSYEWVETSFLPVPRAMAKVIVANAPGVTSAVLAFFLRRAMPFGTLSAAILAAWIGTCGVFLLRHYGCAIVSALGWEQPRACHVFVVAVHHYHLYLQLAWACLIGFVGWGLVRLWPRRRDGTLSAPRIAVAAILGSAVLVFAGKDFLDRGSPDAALRPPEYWFMDDRRFDARSREAALQRAEYWFVDLGVYQWVLRNTRPGALFAVEIEGDWRSPAAFAVMAAGRGLVAAPELFSHPYLDWRAREALRRSLIVAVTRSEAEPVPCEMARAGLWFVLTADSVVVPDRAEAQFSTGHYSVYRATTGACRESAPPG